MRSLKAKLFSRLIIPERRGTHTGEESKNNTTDRTAFRLGFALVEFTGCSKLHVIHAGVLGRSVRAAAHGAKGWTLLGNERQHL